MWASQNRKTAKTRPEQRASVRTPSVDRVLAKVRLDAVGVATSDRFDNRVFSCGIGIVFIRQEQPFADYGGRLTFRPRGTRLCGHPEGLVVRPPSGGLV